MSSYKIFDPTYIQRGEIPNGGKEKMLGYDVGNKYIMKVYGHITKDKKIYITHIEKVKKGEVKNG